MSYSEEIKQAIEEYLNQCRMHLVAFENGLLAGGFELDFNDSEEIA